jgi:diacylglycerol kinase family enzyme
MGEANGDVFTLFTNIGITASVSKKVEFRLKKKIGQLAYIFEAIKQFKLHEGFYYTVRFDNSEAQLSGASHQIMIINSKINEHLPIVIAPESKVTKPKLTLHIYRTQSNKFKIIYSVLLYIVSFGRINRWTITKEVSNLHITTKPQVPYSLDGEVHQEKELIIKAAAKSIKILC